MKNTMPVYMDNSNITATYNPITSNITSYGFSEYENSLGSGNSENHNKDSIWTPEVVTKVSCVMTVMVFTLVGNFFLIALLTYKKSRRRKRVNIFIINLAIGDLAVAFITMTTEIMFVAFGEWVLGPFLCKLSVYLQVVTLSSATFILTGMSMDRYQVIVRPMQSLAKRPKIWTKVVSAWVFAFIFAIPQLVIFLEEKKVINGITKKMCVSHGYTAQWQRKFYFSFLSTYVLFIPSIIMLYCYYNIAKVVWARAGSQRGPSDPIRTKSASPRMSVKHNLVSASKQKVVKMTLTVIIGFLVCLTPYFVISLIRIFSNYQFEIKTALSLAEIVFMLHSAVNPVLYAIFTLRLDHIKAFIPCARYHRKKTSISHRVVERRRKLPRLRLGVTAFKKHDMLNDTSAIIANHATKEEREMMARCCRSPNSIKTNMVSRRWDNGPARKHREKAVQVNENLLTTNTSMNGLMKSNNDYGTTL